MEFFLSMSFGLNLILFFFTIRILKTNFANIFLLALLTLFLIGTAYVISLNYFSFSIPLLTHFINSLPTIVGGLTYLYVFYSINSLKKIHPYSLLHFLPLFFAVALSYCDYENISVISIILNIGLNITVSIIYFIWSLKILKKHKKIIQNNFSKTEKIDLEWLAFIVKMGLISYLIYFLIIILWASDIQIGLDIGDYTNSIVLIFILSISYYSLSSTTVFEQISNFNAKNTLQVKNIDKKTETKELISLENAEIIFQKITSIIETKKLYKNENLMLENLAKELDLHSKYLSSVINRIAGKNFFDFINHFRIKEFNIEVLNPKNKQQTFLAIAFSCGFGSKSAFNRAYKSKMGFSPSVFVKKQQAN